jgi:hypothetical protein
VPVRATATSLGALAVADLVRAAGPRVHAPAWVPARGAGGPAFIDVVVHDDPLSLSMGRRYIAIVGDATGDVG